MITGRKIERKPRGDTHSVTIPSGPKLKLMQFCSECSIRGGRNVHVIALPRSDLGGCSRSVCGFLLRDTRDSIIQCNRSMSEGMMNGTTCSLFNALLFNSTTNHNSGFKSV